MDASLSNSGPILPTNFTSDPKPTKAQISAGNPAIVSESIELQVDGDERNSGDPLKPEFADEPKINLKLNDVITKLMTWVIERNKKPAKYPAPVDHYFQQLDFWKLGTGFAAAITVVGSFHSYKLIDEECMHELVSLLSLAMFSLCVAHTLQEMIPEISALAMLTGVGLVISSLHSVGLEALPGDAKMRLQLPYILVPGYVFLLLICLYKIFTEDVRQ